MGEAGSKLGALVAVDTALAVPAGGAWTAGASFDLGDPTIVVQALRLGVQLAITNAGTTNGYDLSVKIQWSPSGSTWPNLAKGEGALVAYHKSTVAGDDLDRSRLWAISRPQARYGRLIYSNANATDAVSVSSWVAQHKAQG